MTGRANTVRDRANVRRRRVVGIVGGMGPLATADFYTKLVRATPARRDQDHLHVIIDSDPAIPDRTAAVLDGGPDPTPALVAASRRLVRAGAQLIAIPCNSAHAFLDPIRRATGVPVLDMMQEVAAAAGRIRPAARAIGILATSATLRMRLYHRALAERGMSTVEPTAAEQERVMAAIRAVKAGDTGPRVRARVHAVIGSLVRRGAQAIVLGCTELPLVADRRDIRVPVLDGTEILARAAIREAGENPDRTREFPAPSRRSHKAISPASRAAEPARRS